MTITKAEFLRVIKNVKNRQDSTNNATYVSKDPKRGLSTLDYTTEDKEKLAGIEDGAQVNKITSISVDGTNLTPDDNKNINIDMSSYLTKDGMASVFQYRGSVTTYADLPTLTENEGGYVYDIQSSDSDHKIKAGDNVVWTGTEWDPFAGELDTSKYVTKEDGKGLSSNDFTDEEKKVLIEFTDDEAVTNDDINAMFTVSTVELGTNGYDTYTLQTQYPSNYNTLTALPDKVNVTGTSLANTFAGASKLEYVYIDKDSTSEVTNMSNMFKDCTSLSGISEMDTSQVTDMSGMFSGCSSLTSVPVIDMINCTNYTDMFKGCTSLNLIVLDNVKEDFDVSKLSVPEGCTVEFVEK